MAKGEKHYTISEAAKKLKVSRQAIHDAIRDKRIKPKREKRPKTISVEVIVISESQLEKYRKTISRSHQERGKKN